MRDTSEEVSKKSKTTFFDGLLHTEMQVLDDQLELIKTSCVRTQDVV